MKKIIWVLIFKMFLFSQDPPYWGTIFIAPEIITSNDESTFENTQYVGRGFRTMYDRRVNDWITVNAYLFDTYFSDGLYCEIQVNPEFSSVESSLQEAQFYALEIGRLPTTLRQDLETVWIHMGVEPFGGGNNNILIHTGQSVNYINDGILEETLVHEASHTSLDSYHAYSQGWVAAQNLDGEFISQYAQDYPSSEDVAESFLTWLAVRYRADRISSEMYSTITETIPNRIQYFDNQFFDMFPLNNNEYVNPQFNADFPMHFNLSPAYPNPFNPITHIKYSVPKNTDLTISIYDINGKMVDEIYNGYQVVGTYSLTWNAVDKSSGLYILKFDLGDPSVNSWQGFTQTQKLMLVK